MGGFADAVHQCLARHDLTQTPILHLALPETFVPHGKRDELLSGAGLDAPGIARSVGTWVQAHQRQYT
jgi:1-deoxy-D-xylulose-5-phosphate synthase